jgi:hypothetical protein
MPPVNYHVTWYTRSGCTAASIKHEGHMIGILPATAGWVGPDDFRDGQEDRAIIIEKDPPGEIPGTRFKVVDLSAVEYIGLWSFNS